MNSEFLKMNEKGQKRKIHNGPTRTTMTRRRRPTQPNPKPVLDVCFSYCSYCTRKDALLPRSVARTTEEESSASNSSALCSMHDIIIDRGRPGGHHSKKTPPAVNATSTAQFQ
jgi:hypothetical protein